MKTDLIRLHEIITDMEKEGKPIEDPDILQDLFAFFPDLLLDAMKLRALELILKKVEMNINQVRFFYALHPSQEDRVDESVQAIIKHFSTLQRICLAEDPAKEIERMQEKEQEQEHGTRTVR